MKQRALMQTTETGADAAKARFGTTTGGGASAVPAATNSEETFGPFVYIDGRLAEVRFDDGYCTIDSSGRANYHYFVRDYMGSVCVVTDDEGNIEQQNAYYAWGGIYSAMSVNPALQDRKYSGKPFDRRHGLDLYDYGARRYDPALSRWTSPDPLCEYYYNISPYAFCTNNPIRYIDPDGRWLWDATGNLKAQVGDNSFTLAMFLGTSQTNAMTILNRVGVTANDKGVLNLKAGQVLSKNDLWIGFKSKNGAVVKNTKEAILHYFHGKGEAADVGDESTRELLSSKEFHEKHAKITSVKVSPTGYFAVDLTNSTFHIGRTTIDYRVSGNGITNSVTYTLFSRDGFWDPDFITERTLGMIPIISDLTKTAPDRSGPNLERFGGTPYYYKTRERTYFFKPVEYKK